MEVEPVVLQGSHVRLEPLRLEHQVDLCEVAFDEDLWRWTTVDVRTPDDLRRYIDVALHEQAIGVALAFATVDLRTGKAVGSTRFAAIERAHRRVEIGWTWLGRSFQRTALNTEAKYLMLRHAFETLGCIRVELKTDALNTRSRAAILRLGALEEGTLRKHLVTDRGRIRDTVYYAIVDDEWPAVKKALEEKLGRQT